MSDENLGMELIARLEHQLPPEPLAALGVCRDLARSTGVGLYLVGGVVRDLILGRTSVDLDLCLEGEVAEIAEALAKQTTGRVVMHERFGTATVTGPGFQLDLARTRRETYVHPGALPQVQPASLAQDLARRDFTINAVALRVARAEGELVDPYRGVADIRSGLIRVLHEASFQDDATRVLRAVRYASRFGFKIAMHTEALIRRDLSFLGTVSGPRLRRELALQFEEGQAVEGVQLAARLGVLAAIHPSLRLNEPVASRWRRTLAGESYAPRDELGFCVLADPRDDGAVRSVSGWLHLAGRIERSLQDLVRLRTLSSRLEASIEQPVAAVEMLDNVAPAAVWALAVLSDGDAARTCSSYLRDWRRVQPELRGDDLLALGVDAGAAVGEMLRELRNQRLLGRVSSREQETEFVRSHLAARQEKRD